MKCNYKLKHRVIHFVRKKIDKYLGVFVTRANAANYRKNDAKTKTLNTNNKSSIVDYVCIIDVVCHHYLSNCLRKNIWLLSPKLL